MAYKKTIPAGPVGLAIAMVAAESSIHEAREQAQRNMANEMLAKREAAKKALSQHAYSWQQPNDLGDLRPDIDELLEQKEGVNLNG